MKHSHNISISDPENLLIPPVLNVGDLVICRAGQAVYMANASCVPHTMMETVPWVRGVVAKQGLGEMTGIWHSLESDQVGVVLELLYPNGDSKLNPTAWYIWVESELRLFAWLTGIGLLCRYADCITV